MARSVEEIKAEIERDTQAWCENNLIGRVAKGDIFIDVEAYINQTFKDRLPVGFHARLINPRIAGNTLFADGIEIEELDDGA